jgi:hypothetical protein
MKRILLRISIFSICALVLAGCGGGANTANNAANNAANANTTPAAQNISVSADRPQKIKDMMAARGEQDSAAPTLKILSPKPNESLASSTVKVKLELAGDLKGYSTGMDPNTHTGNHIHVILDNQPYEAYYDLGREFELRNVVDGEHTLRVFPSRPWHESYKNDGAFQMVSFTVKGGKADPAKPTTANGNTMANASNANTSNANAAPAAGPSPEGKDMKQSTAGIVDPKRPLLTYSRPKGEYKGEDAASIMFDFWLMNAKLKDEGGAYRVRYTIDKEQPGFIDKWAPIWVSGFSEGKHTIVFELIGADGRPIDNGGYNSTVREITVTK